MRRTQNATGSSKFRVRWCGSEFRVRSSGFADAVRISSGGARLLTSRLAQNSKATAREDARPTGQLGTRNPDSIPFPLTREGFANFTEVEAKEKSRESAVEKGNYFN